MDRVLAQTRVELDQLTITQEETGCRVRTELGQSVRQLTQNRSHLFVAQTRARLEPQLGRVVLICLLYCFVPALLSILIYCYFSN